jgi:hypothetical protein
MKVEWEGTVYDLDYEEMDTKQARYLKSQLGLTPQALREALRDQDPDAILGWYWLMMAQNGKIVDIGKVNIKIFKFIKALVNAAKEEAENPTQSPPSDSEETPS